MLPLSANAAAPAEAILLPRVPALMVRRNPDCWEITHLGQNRTGVLEGQLARELEPALRGGEPTARVRAMGQVSAVVAWILDWRDHVRIPVTPMDALRLDGWGTLFLELVGRCNERCVHCYAGSAPEVEAALEQPVAERVIDDAAELGFTRVQFTGGDPLLCSFLPELVQRARERGIADIEIYTNGLALSSELIERLASYAPSFAFSYYSSDPIVHDAITRTPDSQRRTARAIRLALSRGLAVRASIVIMAENAHTAERTVADLEAMGVGHVAVTTSHDVGRGSYFEAELSQFANPGHAGPSLPAAADQPGRSRRARLGLGKLCVTYQGQVVPCIFNRGQVLGAVTERRLRDIAAAPRPGLGGSGLPLVAIDDYRTRLQCHSCRLTAAALTALGGRTVASA